MATQVTHSEKMPADAPDATRAARVWRPLTDIVETGDSILLMLEMPGVGADDVEVTLERRVLTIHGRSNTKEPERLAPRRHGHGRSRSALSDEGERT